MVIPFFRLRVALLKNAARVRSRNDALRLWGFVLLALLAAASVWLSDVLARASGLRFGDFDAVIAAVILITAAFVPLFTNGRTLTASQFKTFPYTPIRVSVMVVVSSVLGWMPLLISAWLIATVVMHSTSDWLSILFSVLGALMFLSTVQLVMHIAAESAEFLFTTPRRKILKTLIGWLLLVSAAPLILFFFTAGGLSGLARSISEIGSVLEWTPLGSALSAGASYQDSGVWIAIAKLAISAGALVVLALGWRHQVKFAFEFVPKPGQTPLHKSGLGWFERFPSTPPGAIAARSVVYWIRDPRYRLSFAAVPVVVVVSMLAMFFAGAPFTLIWSMPLAVISFFLGWSIHNDVATDSTAIWMHVASGTSGRDDRLGRLAPVLLVGIPLIIVGSTLSIALMGDWRPLPGLLGISASLLLTGAGVSSFSSARWPYPTSRPGESLFIQPQFAGFGAGKTQTITVLVILALSLPALVTGFIGIGAQNLALQLVSLLLGVVGGVGVLYLGARIGASTFDEEGPELIALSQVFD